MITSTDQNNMRFNKTPGILGLAANVDGYLLIKRSNGIYEISGHSFKFRSITKALAAIDKLKARQSDIDTSAILLKGGYDAAINQ